MDFCMATSVQISRNCNHLQFATYRVGDTQKTLMYVTMILLKLERVFYIPHFFPHPKMACDSKFSDSCTGSAKKKQDQRKML